MKSLLAMTTLSILVISASAYSAGFPVKLCSHEFSVPQVTHKNDGSLYVCSSFPAAYITNEQAMEEALRLNTAQANVICGYKFENLVPPRVMARNYSVTVLSLLVCR